MLLTMALPGSVYLFRGEELGLWEVEDLLAENERMMRNHSKRAVVHVRSTQHSPL